MGGGQWTQGRVDIGTAGQGVSDNFKRATSGVAAGTAGIVISSKPGRFYKGVYENGSATAYFLQIFDKATAPVNTDVPIYEKRLPASGEVEIDEVLINGLACTLGIGIAISSTAGTLTLAVANDLAFRSTIFTAQN
jgi:hypothetical protein